MKENNNKSVFTFALAVIFTLTLFLTACSNSADALQAPVDTGDDPFAVNQTQEAGSGNGQNQGQTGQSQAESSLSQGQSGQTQAESGQEKETSSSDASSNADSANNTDSENNSDSSNSADSESNTDSGSSTDSSTDVVPEGSEDESKTAKNPDYPYDEAYCREHYAAAAAVLDEIGWDLRAAYDWCVNTILYLSLSPIDAELGTKWYSELTFETGRGNCYSYAGTLTELARLLGYEAYQIDGHFVGYEELNHSWVEVVVDGERFILDPEYEAEKGREMYLVPVNSDEGAAFNQEEKVIMSDDPTPESIERLAELNWPAEGPYAQFIAETEAYILSQNQQQSGESQEPNPNEGCLGEEDPFE